jgi:hypothetical protein
MRLHRGGDDRAGIAEVESQGTGRRAQGAEEQQDNETFHRILGIRAQRAGRRERDERSDEELRVQKEERGTGLVMSRGDGECGLNARREKT